MTVYNNPNETTYFTVNVPNLYVGKYVTPGGFVGNPWRLYITSDYSNQTDGFPNAGRVTLQAFVIESNDRYSKLELDNVVNGQELYWDKNGFGQLTLSGINSTSNPAAGQTYEIGLVKYINYQGNNNPDTAQSNIELNPIYTDDSQGENWGQTKSNDQAMSFIIYKQ